MPKAPALLQGCSLTRAAPGKRHHRFSFWLLSLYDVPTPSNSFKVGPVRRKNTHLGPASAPQTIAWKGELLSLPRRHSFLCPVCLLELTFLLHSFYAPSSGEFLKLGHLFNVILGLYACLYNGLWLFYN